MLLYEVNLDTRTLAEANQGNLVSIADRSKKLNEPLAEVRDERFRVLTGVYQHRDIERFKDSRNRQYITVDVVLTNCKVAGGNQESSLRRGKVNDISHVVAREVHAVNLLSHLRVSRTLTATYVQLRLRFRQEPQHTTGTLHGFTTSRLDGKSRVPDQPPGNPVASDSGHHESAPGSWIAGAQASPRMHICLSDSSPQKRED